MALGTSVYNYNIGKDSKNNDFWVMSPGDEDDYKNIKDNLNRTGKYFNGACLAKMNNHTDGKIYHKKDKEFNFPYYDSGDELASEEEYSVVLEKCRVLMKYNLVEKNS